MQHSQHTPLRLNLRIAASNNEKLFFSFTTFLSLFLIASLIYDRAPQLIPHILGILFLVLIPAGFLWMNVFDYRLTKVDKPITPLTRDQLFEQWKHLKNSEQLALILIANLPLYRTTKVSFITKLMYRFCSLKIVRYITISSNSKNGNQELKKEELYEFKNLYNAFTTIPKIQKLLLDPDVFFSAEDVEHFEKTSSLFVHTRQLESEKTFSSQANRTEAARAAQKECQLKLAEQRTIAVAHFMLKMVNDPTPIKDITVNSYKTKYNELLNSNQCPFPRDEMPSQNFIIRELRKNLPENFRNAPNIAK